MANVCQTCGDQGFVEALIYCDSCKIGVVHRYCLNITPVPFDDYITWFCVNCDGSDSGSDCKAVDQTAKFRHILKISEKKKKKKVSNHTPPVLAIEDYDGLQDATSVETAMVSSSPTKETRQEFERREISDSGGPQELTALVGNEASVLEMSEKKKKKKKKKKEKSSNHTLPVDGFQAATTVEPMEVSCSSTKETGREFERREISDSSKLQELTSLLSNGAFVLEMSEKKKKKRKRSSNHTPPVVAAEDHGSQDATNVEPMEVSSSPPPETNNVDSYNMGETYAAADPAVSNESYFTTTVSSSKIKRVYYECREKGHLSTACPKKLQNADDDKANTNLDQETVNERLAMPSYDLQNKNGGSYMNETYAANNGSLASTVSSGKIKRRVCYECGEKGHLSTACLKKLQTADDQSNTKLDQETINATPAITSYDFQNNNGGSYMNETCAATNEANNESLASAGKIKRRTCHECGEKGHLSTACPKKLQNADHTNSKLDHQIVDAGAIQVTSYNLQNSGGSYMDESERCKISDCGEPQELTDFVRNGASVLEASEKKKKKKKKKRNRTPPILASEDLGHKGPKPAEVSSSPTKGTRKESEKREISDSGKRHELAGLVTNGVSHLESRNSPSVQDYDSCTSKKRKLCDQEPNTFKPRTALGASNDRLTCENSQLDVGKSSCKESESNMPQTSEGLSAWPSNTLGVIQDKALPIVKPIWRGSISVKEKSIDGLVAHLSSLACRKVHDTSGSLPTHLVAEIYPRLEIWPKSFLKNAGAKDEDIALYFFPSSDSDRKDFDSLILEMKKNDSAMRCVLDNAELLLFTSYMLPEHSRRFRSEEYLWGVFRAKQTCTR